MSNCKTYKEFFEHYSFLVKSIAELTKPGRMTVVHAADVPAKNNSLRDFPGDIIRTHQKMGFRYHARYAIWKEPLRVAIRTRSKGLMHRQLVADTTQIGNAGADYLLVFRKKGKVEEPIAHPKGLLHYVGEREVPKAFKCADGKIRRREDFLDWEDPSTNKLSHWIFQQYASSFWDDIRVSRVLPYRKARDKEEEKHVHPLQLDVIERAVILWSNPGDVVLTPFMGVGSEVWGALVNDRKAIGMELKKSYFRQAQRNVLIPREQIKADLGLES